MQHLIFKTYIFHSWAFKLNSKENQIIYAGIWFPDPDAISEGGFPKNGFVFYSEFSSESRVSKFEGQRCQLLTMFWIVQAM